MIRKAILIQAIFFSAAAVLVISSAALIGFIGSQGFQTFRYIAPAEFFLATTWNPYASREAATEAPAAAENEPRATPTAEEQPASETATGGVLIDGGQLIEPSEPSEGDQLIEPSEPVADEATAGGQLIEPSEPIADETAAETAPIADPTANIAESEPQGVFGILPLLVGSLLTALLTLLVSGPLAILVALFMVEVAPDSVRRAMRTVVEIFASLPSVIFGLLGLIYVVPWVRGTFHTGLGKGILAASLVLVFMTQPTIVTIAEDALRSLPSSLREAAWGIGATRWQMIWSILLPAARPGLITALILGMGRAIGETMAVQMVIGNITEYIPTSLVTGATTMPAAIVTQLPEASTPAQRSALIMVGFVLLVTAFLLIVLARLSAHNTPVKG